MKPSNLKRIIDTVTSLSLLILLGNGAPLEAQTITIKYPSLSPANGNFACVGDTILVTATEANIADLIVPKDSRWSGDAGNTVVSQTDNSITKRFFTYHPYAEQDPTLNVTRNFDFTIRLKDGSTKTVSQAIVARSCPPQESKDPARSYSTAGQKYNFGNIALEYYFENETSNEEHIQAIPEFEPEQPFYRLSGERSADRNQWNVAYRALQITDATYRLKFLYNEGDSLNREKVFENKVIKNYAIEPLGTLTPDKTAYCPGEDIVFSLQLGPNWQAVMEQTIGGDENNIASWFNWDGSPAPVTFTHRVDKEKYFFSTKAAGTSTSDYRCKLKVIIKYANKATKPDLDIVDTVEYDVPIEEVKFNEPKGFLQHDLTICQGEAIPLPNYVDPAASVQEYRDGNNKAIANAGVYVPSKSEEISAIITAPCPWTDKLKINVIDKSKIQSITPATNVLICAGETVSFSATANSPITWNIIVPTHPSANESWEDIESGKVHTRTFSANAMVSAVVGQCDMDSKQFNVQVVQRPTVKLDAGARGCPYTTVNLCGAGGNNPAYSLYDLRTQTDLTSTMKAYLDPNTGLTNYPMRPNDSLRLVYTAGNTTDASGYTPASLTCTNSAEAKIIAYPLPPMRITYDGTSYANGETACVPREEAFTLTASDADTYEWLDLAAPEASQPNRNLTLTKDSLMRVRGVENLHHCFDTFALRCVVSVEHADRVKAQAACPKDEVCFEADQLPSTTYAWYGPDNSPLNVTTPKLCREFQAGQNGVYTLKTQRFDCPESLAYTLTLYPAPKIEAIAPPPLCVGEELVINYHTGIPNVDNPQVEFTKDGLSIVENLEDDLNGDVLRYRVPNVQLTDAGQYFLKVSTNDGCTDRDILDIAVEEPAVVRIVLDADSACQGDKGRISADVTPWSDSYIYQWFFNGQPFDGNSTAIERTWERDDHDIHLEVQQSACTSIADTAVTVIARPMLSGMPKDTGICQGLTICLSPVSDITPQEVVWYWINGNGKINQIKLPSLQFCQNDADESMNGRYYVEVANLAGSKRCASVSDTTRLTVHPTPDLRIEGPNFICDGSTVTLTAVSRIANTFRWQHNGATTAAISIDEAGQYTVTGISAYGCQASASTTLEARPTPYFALPPDTSICRGTSFLIYGPDGMDAYAWNDGSQGKDILAEKGGWYILTVYRNECPYSDSIYVRQTFCGQFHFPTAFTPNDNRVNDTWGAISAAKDEDMAEYDLMVFDRNGKKVFHGKRISEQWDGRYKGELCPPGVYMYSFKALEKLEGIKYQASGTVTIVQ